MAKKTKYSLWENIVDITKSSGKLLTAFAVVAILVGGMTLVENPSYWWVSLLIVAGFFLLIFVMVNARVFVKIVLSTVLMLVLAGVSFYATSFLDSESSGSLIFLSGFFAVFFLGLAISYFMPSGQSRWTALAWTEIFYFLLTWTGILLLNLILLPALIFVPVSLGIFVLFYLFGPGSHYPVEKMPKNFREEALTKRIEKAATAAGMEVRSFEDKEESSYLLWGQRAYMLYPILMDQAFGIIGRHKTQLSYGGKPINSWLRHLSFVKNPFYKAKKADILLVLLDYNNSNGSQVKVIGVSMPDTKNVVPVAVFPAKLLKSSEPKALSKVFAQLDKNLENYVDDLNDKQKEALAKFANHKTKALLKQERLEETKNL